MEDLAGGKSRSGDVARAKARGWASMPAVEGVEADAYYLGGVPIEVYLRCGVLGSRLGCHFTMMSGVSFHEESSVLAASSEQALFESLLWFGLLLGTVIIGIAFVAWWRRMCW